MESVRNSQSGMALIAALVVLMLVTLAGIATMESTAMQLKMANARHDRQQAFEAAEAALRMIEEDISSNSSGFADPENHYFTCSGSTCFKPDCSNGRCFQGIWRTGDNVVECKAVDDASKPDVTPPATSPWETGTGSDYLNVWDSTAKHLTLTVPPYTNDVKYIVEFRCFTPAEVSTVLSNTNAAQVFRITARGMSDSGRSEVMLQSTYKRTDS